MENKTDWYRKLIRKLNKIKSGDLDIDEYIEEVKSKIKDEGKVLSISSVCDYACSCVSEMEKLNCVNFCKKKPKIIQS